MELKKAKMILTKCLIPSCDYCTYRGYYCPIEDSDIKEAVKMAIKTLEEKEKLDVKQNE